jgi:hypothetical protein
MTGRKIEMATKKTSYEAPTPASDRKKALDTALAQTLDGTYYTVVTFDIAAFN